jgi:hypothetical protein
MLTRAVTLFLKKKLAKAVQSYEIGTAKSESPGQILKLIFLSRCPLSCALSMLYSFNFIENFFALQVIGSGTHHCQLR